MVTRCKNQKKKKNNTIFVRIVKYPLSRAYCTMCCLLVIPTNETSYFDFGLNSIIFNEHYY